MIITYMYIVRYHVFSSTHNYVHTLQLNNSTPPPTHTHTQVKDCLKSYMGTGERAVAVVVFL